MPATFASLALLDDKLAASGHHPLTAFWRAKAQQLYDSGRTALIGRVGRGGAKSHTSSKLALNEVLFGEWRIPPGERHYWAFVSARKDEAEQRIVLLESFLRALGVPFSTKGGTISLLEQPRGFKVFACNIGAVSGFRCLGYSADELAKWNVEGVNPSAEVCASLNAMTVTHPGSKRLLISSPLGVTDYHAQRFDQGETDEQMTAFAPSWVANPDGITEEGTRLAEPDERVRLREYGAIPGSGVTDDWFGAGVGRAARAEVPAWEPWMRTYVAIDQAFAQDRFGWAVVSSTKRGVARETVLHESGQWKPDCTPGEMIARFKREVCARYGMGGDDTKRVYCDQHEGYSFKELARREGLFVEVVPWTAGEGETSKATRFRAVRMAMLQGEFVFRDDPVLVEQMRATRGVILPSGGERIEVQRTLRGHGDQLSAVILASSVALGYGAQAVHVEPVRPGSPEWQAKEQERNRERAARAVIEKNRLRDGKRGALEQRIRAIR